MEDWEQFFEEKSRRRADVERRRARDRFVRTALAAVLIAGLIVAAVYISS
jgi:hypothetical protein